MTSSAPAASEYGAPTTAIRTFPDELSIVSYSAADALGMVGTGLAKVKLDAIQ